MLADTHSLARTAASSIAGLVVFVGAAAGIVLLTGNGPKVAASTRELVQPLTTRPVTSEAAQMPDGLKLRAPTQEFAEPLITGSIAPKVAHGTVGLPSDTRAGQLQPQAARLTELDHQRLAALISG